GMESGAEISGATGAQSAGLDHRLAAAGAGLGIRHRLGGAQPADGRTDAAALADHPGHVPGGCHHPAAERTDRHRHGDLGHCTRLYRSTHPLREQMMAVDMDVQPAGVLEQTVPIIRAKRESQFGLMWRRFRRHRLAVVSIWIVGLFYFVALLAEFLAPVDPSAYSARYTYAPPQGLHLFAQNEDGSWHVGPF